MARYRYDAAKDAVVPVSAGYIGERSSGNLVSEGETYRNMFTQELVTVEPCEVRQLDNGATVQIGGRQELRTIDLSSRRRHREFMKSEGLSMPSDWTNHLAKKAKERADAYSTTPDRSSPRYKEIREQVGRAAYEMERNARNKNRR